MHKIISKSSAFLFLIITSIIFLDSCSSDRNHEEHLKVFVEDDLQNKIYFDEIPKRVISLAPNLTEFIFDLGLSKYLIGNTYYCNYPEGAKKIEKVGDMLTFNFEKIVQLKPDLILITVEGNTKETYDKFRELGLKIFVSNPRSYEGIIKTYSDLGKIFNINEQTQKTIDKWNTTVNKIKSDSNNFITKTAMFLISVKPIIAAGKNTFLNEYLELCGLQNIFSDIKINYPVINREEILNRNPDYIIYPSDGQEKVESITSLYPEWKNLKAVKEKNVILVDRDLYLRPGPRFVEALEDFNHRLHHH